MKILWSSHGELFPSQIHAFAERFLRSLATLSKMYQLICPTDQVTFETSFITGECVQFAYSIYTCANVYIRAHVCVCVRARIYTHPVLHLSFDPSIIYT